MQEGVALGKSDGLGEEPVISEKSDVLAKSEVRGTAT